MHVLTPALHLQCFTLARGVATVLVIGGILLYSHGKAEAKRDQQLVGYTVQQQQKSNTTKGHTVMNIMSTAPSGSAVVAGGASAADGGFGDTTLMPRPLAVAADD